jgi:hypothetical protein
LVAEKFSASLSSYYEGDNSRFDVQKVENNIGGYSRIDIYIDGKQLMSLGDLGAVARHTQMIGEAIWSDDYKKADDDWIEVLRVAEIKNMSILLLENGLDKVEQLTRSDSGGWLIQVNENPLNTVEVCDRLRQIGREDLVPSMLSGIATRAAMLAVLPNEGSRGYLHRHDEPLIKQVFEDMKYVGGLASKEKEVAQKYLAGRIEKGIAFDGTGMAREWMVLGIGYVFSNALGDALDRYWKCLYDGMLDCVRLSSLNWDNDMELQDLRTMGGYVAILAAGMNMSPDDFDCVIDEFSAGWPKDSRKDGKRWGGDPKELGSEIDNITLKNEYREWYEEGGIMFTDRVSYQAVYDDTQKDLKRLAQKLTK